MTVQYGKYVSQFKAFLNLFKYISTLLQYVSESKWEPPDEGYVSLEKQKNKKEFKDAIKRRRKEEKSEQKINIKIDKKAKLKKGQDDKIKECCVSVGPAPKPDPYGAWSVIEPK